MRALLLVATMVFGILPTAIATEESPNELLGASIPNGRDSSYALAAEAASAWRQSNQFDCAADVSVFQFFAAKDSLQSFDLEIELHKSHGTISKYTTKEEKMFTTRCMRKYKRKGGGNKK